MDILISSSYPSNPGPIYKIAKTIKTELNKLSCKANLAFIGSRGKNEAWYQIIINRLFDYINFVKSIISENPDLVFFNSAHDWKGLLKDLPLGLLLRLLKIDYVILFHGNYGPILVNPQKWVYRIFYGFYIRKSLGVFTLASQEEKAIRMLWPSVNAKTVRSPFAHLPHTPRSDWQADLPYKILFVGRLTNEKGILDLIKAIKLVKEKISVKLTAIGMGPLFEECQSLIEKMNLKNHIFLSGQLNQQEVWDELSNADLFVLPTYQEGFPVVILEAMACGLPIITTPVGGIPDFLTGKNTMFVEPKNISELSDAIITLCLNEKKRENMGKSNLEIILDFGPSEVVKTYYSYIQSWMKNK